MAEDKNDIFNKSQEFLQMLNKQKDFIQELMKENERLRYVLSDLSGPKEEEENLLKEEIKTH